MPETAPMTSSPAARGRYERGWTVAFALLCVGVVGWLLVITRHASWWADDWQMIFDRLPWTVGAVFDGHYGHPIISVMLWWKVVFSTLGLTSYVPLMLFILVGHAVAAAAVFTIVRRLVGAPVGFAAGALMLLLGSGAQAIVVPAAANHTWSTAVGLWALAIMLGRPDRRGLVAAAVLLVVALTFGASALFYGLTIAGVVLIIPERRREIVVVVPMAIAYLAWRARFDHEQDTSIFSGVPIADLVDFTRAGIAHAIGSITGLGDAAGLALGLVLLVGTGWYLVGRRPLDAARIAGALGLLVVYGLTALTRAFLYDDPTEGASPSRYVYLAAPFLLVAGAGWLAARGSARSVRWSIPVVAVLGVAIAINQPQLDRWARFVTDQGQNARALITLVARHAGSPAMPRDRALPDIPDLFMGHMPTAARLLEVIGAYGSPVDPDPLAPDRPPIPASATERALLGLVRDEVGLVSASPPTRVVAPEVVATAAADVGPFGGCIVASASGDDASVTVVMPGGSTLALSGPDGAAVSVSLSGDGSFLSTDHWDAVLGADAAQLLALPDLRADWAWQVRVTLPARDAINLCAVANAT